MRILPLIACGLLAAGALAAPVQVTVEQVTYPVVQGKKANGNEAPAQAAKLDGVDQYTTEAVTLENEYLRVTVLPELGGRLVHALYKPTNKEMFWTNDRIENTKSWSMGGGRWSFPFWEHGRHFDETGGYTVVQQADGSATLAVDMRFEEFLKPEETKRYGRATNLRLAQYLTLKPGETKFTWTARVDNPLPIPYGFKLWYLLRQPATQGIVLNLPAAGVTGHVGTALKAWENTAKVDTIQDSFFALGVRHPFSGWYLPERELNVLAVVDRARTPGAKQVLYPAGRAYIEMWGGNHEVFEEPGHLLPAFGSFTMPVTVVAASGIGAADFANATAAVACHPAQDWANGWLVGIAPTRRLDDVTVTLTVGEQTQRWQTTISPERPFTANAPLPGAHARLAINAADGAVLVDQTFPVDPGPLPEAAYQRAKARIDATMPGGKDLYAECTDLVTDPAGPNLTALGRIANDQATLLKTSNDIPTLLDAARRLMRVRKDSPEVLAGLEKVLAQAPDHAEANLYKGMALLEAGKADEAAACLDRAQETPGGRYLLALGAVAKRDYANAVTHLRALLAMPAAASFRGADDPALGELQTGSTPEGSQPRLLLAIALQAQGSDEAQTVLRQLVADDPALIEAWMLLGDEARVATLTHANPGGKQVAEANLAALRAGTWRGIGRP